MSKHAWEAVPHLYAQQAVCPRCGAIRGRSATNTRFVYWRSGDTLASGQEPRCVEELWDALIASAREADEPSF